MKKVICLFLLLLSQLSINAQVDKTQTESKEIDYLFKYEEVVPSNIPQSVMWLNLKKWVLCQKTKMATFIRFPNRQVRCWMYFVWNSIDAGSVL